MSLQLEIEDTTDCGNPNPQFNYRNCLCCLGKIIEAAIDDRAHRASEKIAKKLFSDLTDRRGVGGAIEMCDEDVKQEMRETWAKLVEKELKKP